MLQIGEDVDYLLIPREVRLAGGVWRVISKPATKEAEFRERLTQFLEEQGRTLEDVARIIEKSTPHPPQPPKKPKEPRVRRRVQQMVTPTPRLVVGTYDSSNASDSEFSDFETSRDKSRQGPRRGKKVRKMPVSYLGSKFLGSDVESEDDEELVEAFLRRQEKQPPAPPARRRVNLPVPMFEDNLGPQLSKADRWREYVSQVSWGKLKRRVKGWAPRAGPGVGEARLASIPVESAEVSSGTSPGDPGDPVENVGDVCAPQASPRRWRPKINWASFRRRRKEQTAPTGQGADIEADQGEEAADNQREEAIADQREEAAGNQREEAIADQREEAAGNQREEAIADQGEEAAGNQREEAIADQREEAAGNQREEAIADQGEEAAGNQREEAADNQREEAIADQGEEATDNQRAEAPADHRPQGADNLREEALADQGSEATDPQREEAIHDQRERAPAVQGAGNQRAQARAGQRAEAAHNQRARAPGIQEAEASAAQGATGTASGARARKQVKTVRFQTPGRFSWFRKHRRAFWHTPRLPTLPKRVPRAGEARSLRVLRAEARAEAEQGEREDQL
ncbi:PREDICTED: coiled-coil domain-containing protein 8 isoform X2 [Cercocebus atys]|uniref:coiled-coil domain-containing protein 8 isoform X2 n=1 Tax=Cercocebus atys TaxID=9531 RepID=UPI0005F41ACB|nr:PREDICTED: coiled-coil domain-containing protein 8 isoform X2 [Cercocebus atys]